MRRTAVGLLAALGAASAWMQWPNESPAPPLAVATCQRAEPSGAGGVPSAMAPLIRSEVTADLALAPTGVAPCAAAAVEPLAALGGDGRGELVVLDGETSEPVIGYGVRCVPHADVRQAGPGDAIDALGFALRARSTHAAGWTELRGLRPGKHLLLVEPDDRVTFAPMPPVVFDVGEAFTERQVVRLPRAGQRALVVVRRDGMPVAGTVVELLLPLEPCAAAEVTFETPALSPRQCFERGRLPPTMMVQRVVTDAAGGAMLRGARHQRHALRLLGPGHMPLRIWDLILDGTSLRIEVGDGAVLRGRVESLAELQRMPELRGGRLATYRPGLQWVDARDAERRVPARRQDAVPLAADGSFCIEGIAPGSWNVLLTRWVFEPDGRETMTTEWIARVPNVSAGEERVLELSPRHLGRGRIEGTLWGANGPWPNARCVFEAVRPDGVDGMQPAIATMCTDAWGQFTTELAPGTWQAAVAVEEPPGQWRKIRLPGSYEVQHGRTIRVDLGQIAAPRQAQ